MNNNLELGNNNLTNGYIYKELVSRIATLENQVKSLMTMIENANNDMKISIKDYVSIIKELKERVTQEEFDKHIGDHEIHHHRSSSLQCELEAGQTIPDKN